MHKTTKAALIAAALIAAPATAAFAQTDPLENLSQPGRDAYAVYLKLAAPKAFAVAEDGAIGYSAGGDSATARANALARCGEVTKDECRIFSVDGQTVAEVQGLSPELAQLARANTDAADLKGEVLADYQKAEGAKAIAMSSDGAFGWVVRDNEEQARQDALAQCQTYGKECSIQASAPAAKN